MARLNYISTAEYVPMSMQDLLVPLTLYKEAYEKSEAEYKDLTTKSNAFAYLSQSAPEGSKARAIYEKYANDLRVQAEDIARNGLSMSNRSALASLGQRYSGEIGMLESAQKAMEEHKKTWMAQRANDPSMLFATNTFTLDNYLYGNTPNMYAVSGNELYKKGMALGAAASSRMFRSGDAGSTLAGMYRDYVQIYGYSPETIAKFRRDMSVIPELQQGVMDVLRANGVTQNLKGEDLMRAAQQVMNGAIDGAVYKEQHDIKQDLSVMTAAQRDASARGWAQMAIDQMWKQKEYDLKAAALQAASGSTDSNFSINPTPMFSDKEVNESTLLSNRYSKYFNKDPKTGAYRLNSAGLKKYQEQGQSAWVPSITGGGMMPTGQSNDFKDFVDNILGGKDLMEKKQYGNLGNKWAEYNKKQKDAVQRTKYGFSFKGTEMQKAAKQKILAALGSGDAAQAIIKIGDQGYSEGDKLKKSELAKDDYTVLGTYISPYGETFIVQDKEGNTNEYILPPGIHQRNQQATASSMLAVKKIQEFFRDVQEGKVNATEEDIAAMNAKYKEALQRAYMYHSNLWLDSTVKPQEFNPYNY